jgi:hypothetical protein
MALEEEEEPSFILEIQEVQDCWLLLAEAVVMVTDRVLFLRGHMVVAEVRQLLSLMVLMALEMAEVQVLV